MSKEDLGNFLDSVVGNEEDAAKDALHNYLRNKIKTVLSSEVQPEEDIEVSSDDTTD